MKESKAMTAKMLVDGEVVETEQVRVFSEVWSLVKTWFYISKGAVVNVYKDDGSLYKMIRQGRNER